MSNIEQLIEEYNKTVNQLQELSIAKERLFGAISILQEQQQESAPEVKEEPKEE